MAKRPNILFLMSDQHRADVTGFQDTVVRTPALDWLAETGVVFQNAYTPSPICIPARQSLMAGQLPKTCGCISYGDDLPPNSMTFARRFSQYAYNTVCAGKLHHMGIDQMQGWRTRIAPDASIGDRYVEDKVEEEFARYSPQPGTGKWSNQRELEEARVALGPHQKFDHQAFTASQDFLERYFQDPLYLRPQSHRPLLFKLSLLQPHYPFFTSQERLDYYLNRVPIYNQKPNDHPVLSLSQQGKPVNASEETIRRVTAIYYGMIETIDEYFAQIMKQLKELGENLDDWIIVYTSDHGEMLGEHGIWEKTRFYEGSVRVPLIIRWPARFQGGRVVNENVNLCDLFATLCDLTGIETPQGLDSRSLVPLLMGEPTHWFNESISQMGKNHVMIKQDDLKYQYYGEGIPEVLFDLKRDPGENTNFAQDSRYSEAMVYFHSRLSQLGYGPDADPAYQNAGYAALAHRSNPQLGGAASQA